MLPRRRRRAPQSSCRRAGRDFRDAAAPSDEPACRERALCPLPTHARSTSSWVSSEGAREARTSHPRVRPPLTALLLHRRQVVPARLGDSWRPPWSCERISRRTRSPSATSLGGSRRVWRALERRDLDGCRGPRGLWRRAKPCARAALRTMRPFSRALQLLRASMTLVLHMMHHSK